VPAAAAVTTIGTSLGSKLIAHKMPGTGAAMPAAAKYPDVVNEICFFHPKMAKIGVDTGLTLPAVFVLSIPDKLHPERLHIGFEYQVVNAGVIISQV
jgi:hypothetical protein